MNTNIAYTGNKGDEFPLDCFIKLELKNSGGHDIIIHAISEFSNDTFIRELAENILSFFEIDNARIEIFDRGASKPILAARIEAAVKELTKQGKEYLLPLLEENKYNAQKDNFRISNLYVPGNSPKMLTKAGTHSSDTVTLDLEDSVALDKKSEARYMVRNALRGIDFCRAERAVRINPFPKGLADLKYIVPHNLHLIVIPKCEYGEHIQSIKKEIDKIKTERDIKKEIYFLPVIETALGVENAVEIATATSEVAGLAIGLEDYTADIGAQRTKTAKESFYARTRIVNACKAAGIQAIDSVFSDIKDEEGLRITAKESKALGFDGMGCIHPKQIKVLHESFAPEKEEIEKAKKIINADSEAKKKGLGVASLNSEMIEAPVVKRAKRILDLAVYFGLISGD